MSHAFHYEPHEILGVAPQAGLGEIREAYRGLAQKHHPDHGGEAWVFRLVSQAYQVLSVARIAARNAEEELRATAPRVQPQPQPHSGAKTAEPPHARPVWERRSGDQEARAGVRDDISDPLRLIDVEILSIRYAIDDPTELLLKPGSGSRTLSCSINANWPARDADASSVGAGVAEATVRFLDDLFEKTMSEAKCHSVQSHGDHGTFRAWASFPEFARAWEAFKMYRAALAPHGLGVEQWNREILMPREGKSSR